MCRLVAYLGHDIIMEEVLVKPSNSIVRQSLHAKESQVPTNGDGFGIGWYVPPISKEPALFTSILPAWNDRNLLHLTAKTKSNCFFAHVRAASSGGVNQYNCHPFSHSQWMFMHNGQIACFSAVKRHLRRLLDDDIYSWIKGETDSEHFFALFLQLAKEKDLTSSVVVADTLCLTIDIVNQLVEDYGKQHLNSSFNFCLSDGQRLFATRYCSLKSVKAETLHYFSGHAFKPQRGIYNEATQGQHQSVLVSSEKLTKVNGDWQAIPQNHLLIVERDWSMTLLPM